MTMEQNTSILSTVAITGITTVLLYYLTVGIAVDAVDDFVEADILAKQIPDLSIANYILFINCLVIAGSFLVTEVLLTKELEVGIFSVAGALVLVAMISMVGLMGFPGFQFSPDKYLITIPLFAVFVVNPATFQIIFAISVMALFVIFYKVGAKKP